MKKYFTLLLMLLLLAGCSNENVEGDTTESVETTPAGYYEEDSYLERATGGVVRQYALPDSGYRFMATVGDRLLLATDSETAKLTLLSGDRAIPVGESQIAAALLDNYRALFNGFVYYDASLRQVVYLDPQLQQIQCIDLPEEMSGEPIISPDGSQIFYCAGEEIRAIDVEHRISRLIKTQTAAKQTLTDAYFNGKILACSVADTQGNVNMLYISAETGQTLKTDNHILFMTSYGDDYLLLRQDGLVQQRAAGKLDTPEQQFNVMDTQVAAALELGGVVGYTADESGLILNFYDLTSGKKTASVTIPGVGEPKTLVADRWSGCVWLLVNDPEKDGQKLLRWDIKAAPLQEETVYTGPLFTAQNPDEAGLDALKSRVNSLNKKYGVRIRIWMDAVKSPGTYTLIEEHQTSVISDMLDQLQLVLAEFPKSFLSKSISSKVRICLVRSIDGEVKGVQYWDGAYAFVALSAGVDVRSEFLKGLGFVIDSHVLGNSAKYDYWETLNPENFQYGGAINEAYISGPNRAFVDMDSMTSGTIDRSRIFWQAMIPDNRDMFQSETMQKKLTMLCKAIRDAWSLKRKPDVYPWEQYLTESIAYKK